MSNIIYNESSHRSIQPPRYSLCSYPGNILYDIENNLEIVFKLHFLIPLVICNLIILILLSHNILLT
jgi:hypothetical protein